MKVIGCDVVQTGRLGIVTAWKGLCFVIPLLEAQGRAWDLIC